MKHEKQEQKVKKIKELFVKELARAEGDVQPTHAAAMDQYTTLALGEESGR
ncbi:hypothetical protein [Archangium primigenium]|uniref:hypothetical protein n=1 Tax=[Archangium] primigenium TaxID=2792470 RepID=UPI001958D582|nr:hypothetical protein [Archangium primigenium]MBM7117825.1 hypothetical protein [Archangium primigenium]